MTRDKHRFVEHGQQANEGDERLSLSGSGQTFDEHKVVAGEGAKNRNALIWVEGKKELLAGLRETGIKPGRLDMK